MNNLHRELAPISDAAWAQIDQEATRTLKRYLAARRVVDVPEPKGATLAAVGTGHTKPIDAPSDGVQAVRRAVMGQISVITGPERRRRWSDEQKIALVEAAFAPGANVAEAARAADICTSLLYRWRQELSGKTSTGFSRAVLIDDQPVRPAAVTAAGADASIVVEFRTGERALISAGASADLVTATLRALR